MSLHICNSYAIATYVYLKNNHCVVNAIAHELIKYERVRTPPPPALAAVQKYVYCDSG